MEKPFIKHFLILINIALALCLLSVGNVRAQNQKITIESNQIAVWQVFELIEKQSSYTVAYNRTKFNANKKISLFVRNVDIKEVLTSVLNNTEWTYSLEGNHIIIVERQDQTEQMTQGIKGYIYDKSTGLPLPAALIVLADNPSKGALSDVNGFFRIDSLPSGRYDVKASCMGFQTLIYREIKLNSTHGVLIDIHLTENLFQLNEIIVKAQSNKEQPLNPMVLAGGRMFSIEEASRYAGGFDDPARLATSFAGVSGGVGDNSVVIHGYAPHLLQWKLEGMEIGNPNHFADLTTVGGGIFSSLSSHVLGNSDFLTGTYPAQYNNALSGILDMKLRNGNNQDYENNVQASIIGIDVSSEGPLKKGKQGSYLLNYRNATFALIKKYIPDMDINDFGYQDLSFKIHVPYRSRNSLSVWGLALRDQNYDYIEKQADEWSSTNRDTDISGNQLMASAGITNTCYLNDRMNLTSLMGITYTNNNLQPDSFMYMESSQLNLKNHSYNINTTINLNYKINSGHTNKSGVTWTSMSYNYFYYNTHDSTWVEEQGFNAKIKGHTNLISAFSNSLYHINYRTKLSLGLSWQYFLLNHNKTIEPRFAIDYLIDDKRSLTFAYGLHSRLERLSTYFIQEENGFSNKNLDFIKTHQFVLSYKRKISDLTFLKIEPYYHSLFNIPMVTGTAYSTLNGLSFLMNVPLSNEGKGISKGVDLTFERYLSHGYYYMLTGSLFDSKYRDKEGHWYNTRYNYRFLLNLLGGKEWFFGKNKQQMLSANAKFIFRGGERYNAIDGTETMLQEQLVIYEDKIYEGQFNPNLRIDMTLSYNLNTKSVNHQVAFKILNMTGTKDFVGYKYENNAIVKEEMKIILPNLSYKVSF